jgi:hypothetical protein
MTRGPNGKFIGWGGALASWLPWMLDRAYGTALVEMLKIAARWCDLRAGKQYRTAADSLVTGDDDLAWCQRFALRCSEDAGKWFARKVVLLRAKAEIEGIR